MGRNKVENKNVSRSVSLTEEQDLFIETHLKFNFSKFVQNHLNDYLQLSKYVEKLEKEVENNGKKTT